ncbi:ABC transporter permease [Desulfonema ishimotonii]|uniref:ABC transporter permease n=2 Tax=Desulfonema ishimotonii TaxID=45657 RepID=A0A401FXW0_9BACT|nr:ABC transporter permease [Desulfonema ishimotonii]
MAWRNIWRNRRRSVLTICAIAFACALLVFMLSFQFGTYEAMINTAVRVHTGYFQVQAADYQEKQEIRLVVPDPDAVGRVLDRIANVRAYTFRAVAFSLASSKERTYGISVTGIDPEREATVSSLKSLVRQGEYLSARDEHQALVGALLARNLRVGIGDTVTLLGQGRDGSVAASVVTVRGIFSSGQDAFDRSSIHIPLSAFQEIYFMRGAVHQVVGVTPTLWDVPGVIREAEAGLKGLNSPKPLAVPDWRALMPGLAQGIYMDLISGLIFYLLLIIVVAFSILNTFLMAIFERTREFGVMMAMGTTTGRLTRLLLTESLLMTMMGIVCGVVLGSLVTLWFQAHGIDFGEASEILRQYGISGRMYPRLSIISASVGPALVFFITFWTALYPALRVRRLRPVEAMSYV